MVFERLQGRIARLKAEDPAVAMDHDIHEVGIFESDRRPSERRFIGSTFQFSNLLLSDLFL